MSRLLFSVASVQAASPLLSPNDSHITYVGRTCSSSKGTARLLDWAGVHVTVRFSGSALAANLAGSSTGDRFLAVVDGVVLKKFLVPSGTMQAFTLADGLNDGKHIAELWRISEDNAWSGVIGATEFGGFSLPDGGEFLAPAVANDRSLEFWGDSNVAGWCVDGSPSGSDTPQAPVQNTYETWAARLARALNATFVAEAISGVGVTDNSGGGGMYNYVDGACSFSGSDWNYTTWSPDALIFWLGLNDAHPQSKAFQKAYVSLMEHAAAKYAYAVVKPKLIHVCGSAQDGSVDPCTRIQAAIDDFNKGRSDGFESFYAPIDVETWNSVCHNTSLQGCDGHYNPAGHELVKSSLLLKTQEVLGWSGNNAAGGFVV